MRERRSKTRRRADLELTKSELEAVRCMAAKELMMEEDVLRGSSADSLRYYADVMDVVEKTRNVLEQVKEEERNQA